MKFGHVVFEICERTDIQTDTLIAVLRTLPEAHTVFLCILYYVYCILYRLFSHGSKLYVGLCFIDIMSYLTVIRSHDRKVAINYYYYYYYYYYCKNA